MRAIRSSAASAASWRQLGSLAPAPGLSSIEPERADEAAERVRGRAQSFSPEREETSDRRGPEPEQETGSVVIPRS